MGGLDTVAQVALPVYGLNRQMAAHPEAAFLPYGVTKAAIAGAKLLNGGDPATSAGASPALPPPAPDLASDTVQRAAAAKRLRLLMGGMTGPLDLSGGAAKPAGLTGT